MERHRCLVGSNCCRLYTNINIINIKVLYMMVQRHYIICYFLICVDYFYIL